jgi:hypothetical protein
MTRRPLKLAVATGVAALAAAAVPSAASAGSDDSHAYRHGLVPMVGHALDGAANTALGIGLPGLNFQLTYGGGTSGVGVVNAAPKVYLVFWGSQWGTAATDANGYTALSGDPSGTAPRLQAFFKGLGTNSESWSKVMTQYCEGVSSGAKTCPATAAHVPYPTGGALAGVWVDERAAAPAKRPKRSSGKRRLTLPPTSATPLRPPIATRCTRSCRRPGRIRTATTPRPARGVRGTTGPVTSA